VHRVEPGLERRAGILEDRPDQRMKVRTTVVARVRLAPYESVMFSDDLASAAGDSIRVPQPEHKFEESVVICELEVEVF